MAFRPLALAVVLSAGVAGPVALADPPSPQTDAELVVRAQQRGADQATNPEHARRHALVAPEIARLQQPDTREDPQRDAEVDPFLVDWAPARGAELDVSLTNRYGARLHGHLSRPHAAGRLPAVVLLTGGAGTEHAYREMAHGLAEAGYVVLGLNVQGDYGSQLKPADPDPSTPQNEHCEPGSWQQPQEAGVREPGACAGEPAEPALTAEEGLNLVTRQDFAPTVAYYEQVKSRKLFGALDGVRWLLSSANPWRRHVDGERIGIAGHSLGAHGALLAANADPERRFRAAVSFDGFGRLAPTGVPSVPTLFQHQDLSDRADLLPPPALPGDQDAGAFAAAGVPTGVVHLAGSTHQEWSYVPPELLTAVGGASRDGKRVALHYAVAWFDLWLKPGLQADARRRLTAPVFSGSTDGSSRGEGPWDPATQSTVSPRIGGETTQEHLSPLYRSWVDVPGAECADLRAGC